MAFLCLPRGFRRGSICAIEMRCRMDLLPLKKKYEFTLILRSKSVRVYLRTVLIAFLAICAIYSTCKDKKEVTLKLRKQIYS